MTNISTNVLSKFRSKMYIQYRHLWIDDEWLDITSTKAYHSRSVTIIIVRDCIVELGSSFRTDISANVYRKFRSKMYFQYDIYGP